MSTDMLRRLTNCRLLLLPTGQNRDGMQWKQDHSSDEEDNQREIIT